MSLKWWFFGFFNPFFSNVDRKTIISEQIRDESSAACPPRELTRAATISGRSGFWIPVGTYCCSPRHSQTVDLCILWDSCDLPLFLEHEAHIHNTDELWHIGPDTCNWSKTQYYWSWALGQNNFRGEEESIFFWQADLLVCVCFKGSCFKLLRALECSATRREESWVYSSIGKVSCS